MREPAYRDKSISPIPAQFDGAFNLRLDWTR